MKTQSKPRRTRKPTDKYLKLVVLSPADRAQVSWLPRAVAWAAARGIAQWTHHAVVLHGPKGLARFRGDGKGGHVEWNDGTLSQFGEQMTVCI